MNRETKYRKTFDKLLEKYRLIKFKRNEVIYQPGDFLDLSYSLKSGFIRIYTICKSGQEVTIAILKPHSLLPLFFAPNRLKSRYYAETLTPVEAHAISKKELISLMVEDPEVFLEIMENITELFQGLLARIEYLASGNAYTKVVSVLLSLVADSSKRTTELTLDLPPTHRTIASMTGLTRETVTLQMLKLKKKGLTSGKGRRLIIKDIARLREESSCLAEEN
ncbi:MAG TPA: Crp/Fnr family transcriptional regulator [Patescibacteria group bacterium]|nr:Crp/Fnr family transcriptional regulator [Patescibacteria group bacterium]